VATGQENLGAAIITKLRTDTAPSVSLVALTTHSSSNLRIGIDRPRVKGITPYLGVWIAQSLPLISGEVTQYQVASVEFRCYARDELTCVRIADRVEWLLHDKSGTSASFYNFTDTKIKNTGTRFRLREGQDFDQDSDSHLIVVTADVIWIDEVC
jgi:hypothetical protein